MKTLSFDEARERFDTVFELAITGQTVVIAREGQRVAVHCIPALGDSDLAPPGYFLEDYNAEEVAEMNALDSDGFQTPPR